MQEKAFSEIVYRMWEGVPPSFKERIINVALLVEDEPSEDVRQEEGLLEGDTLLGLYQGIPNTLRGEGYGVGMTLPDTITLYRLPILEEAAEDRRPEESEEDSIRRVIAETLWHEVGHYFGLSEEEIHEREAEGTNAFQDMKNGSD
jgi:predicted Zn-dependent protease with MMP-like domain